MADTLESDVVITLLARGVLDEMAQTAEGHCARVDYLEGDVAAGLCRHLNRVDSTFASYVLSRDPSGDDPSISISPDRAIELRNRKGRRLCLFVPSDLVDATISSLGNSFAEIDGRDLYSRALARLRERLQSAARDAVRRVFTEFRGAARPSSHDQLAFVVAVHERQELGTIEHIGLDLWRVGLIADARPHFAAYLDRNRQSAAHLARPPRLGASLRDRIASLGVDEETAQRLADFFLQHPRPFADARGWSRALAAGEGPTFDRWVFPEQVRSDLAGIRLTPLKDGSGAVSRSCKLRQPDGKGGTLLAACGEKEALVVRWAPDPPKPTNVHGWRVAIVPYAPDDETAEFDVDLPERQAKDTVRTARIKLDLDFDEPPERPVCVRITAVDAAGNDLTDTDGPITALSEEFYLVKDFGPDDEKKVSPRRQVVPSLAFGRLEALVRSREERISLDQPAWSDAREQTYFSIRANERAMLYVGVSSLLLALERQTIGEPASGGRFTLEVDEVREAEITRILPGPSIIATGPYWAEFWRTRTALFERIRRSHPRDVLEACDWSPEFTKAALRYAQSYTKLLAEAPPGDLRDALSIDTLSVRVNAGGDERARVILPTHPLRVAWFAAHAALLQRWEEDVARLDRARLAAIDLGLVRAVEPTNVPAFAYGADDDVPYLFFRNLGFHHAVAFPAHVRDPHRRFLDLALILRLGGQPGGEEHIASRLATHLADFARIHPYANPMMVTLINPDRGRTFAAALQNMLTRPPLDEEEPRDPVALSIAAFVTDPSRDDLAGVEGLRQQEDFVGGGQRDFLHPALATSVRSLTALDAAGADGHIAIMSDMSKPVVRSLPPDTGTPPPGGLSLYGMLARFSARAETGAGGHSWSYTLQATAPSKADEHPAGMRHAETLIDAQGEALRAGARLLGPADKEATLGLHVHVDAAHMALIERLHQQSDWVITIDRFFGVDYYDSPCDPSLGEVSRKYLIDSAPEFAEGLGHRAVVTTAWREEVAAILRRAMEDLGFAAIEQSLGRLLHYLKTVSGRLALETLDRDTGGVAAVSLAAVTAWLDSRGRLKQAFLVPVDAHRAVFWPDGGTTGQRRCDLALFALRRGVVEATFIEVKWRRGPLGDVTELAEDMALQVLASAEAVRLRFFNPDRVDGVLQRAYLATVLRFYCDRAQRYGMLHPDTADAFRAHLRQLERGGMEYRPSHEGFIVSLESQERPSFVVRDSVHVTLLAASSFASAALDLSAAAGAIPVAGMPAAEQSPPSDPPDLARVAAGAATSAADVPRTLPADAGSAHADGGGYAGAPTGEGEVHAGGAPLRIELGNAEGHGVDWLPGVQGSPHLFITGIPGQGKSWATTRLLMELSRQGVPALVFDFHGQFAARDNPYRRVVAPTVADAARGLPFSPFECGDEGGPTGWNATASAVTDIFAYVFGLGTIQRDTVYIAVRDAYRACGFGDAHAEGPPARLPTLEDVRRRLERAEGQRQTQNVLARCRPLLEMGLFGTDDAQQRPLEETLRGGLVVDLHGLHAEAVQQAAGAFLLRKVYKDMFGWGVAERPRLAVVLDEAHRLAKDITLPKLMKEGRKFGIVVIVASQGLRDFDDDVLGNAGTKVAFRANYPESRKVAGFFRSRPERDLAALLEGLPVGSALVQTPEMRQAQQVKMHALEVDR